MTTPEPVVITPAEIAELLAHEPRHRDVPPHVIAFTRGRTEPADWSITARADGAPADLYLYDAIGWPGIEPGAIVEAVRNVGARPITVHLNSPGGDVFAGWSIFHTLRAHRAGVDVVIEGLAGSIASIVALAGASVRMVRPSLLMIHEPRALAIGTSHDMRHMAGVLDKATSLMAGVYAERVPDRERVRAWMHAETWFTPEQALDAGLITGIDETRAPDAALAASARFAAHGYPTAPPAPPPTAPRAPRRPHARELARVAARSFALLAGLPTPTE